jgi:dGTP triphosphohydrolase
MLQNSGSVTTRINPPLSPAEREQRYQQVLRESLTVNRFSRKRERIIHAPAVAAKNDCHLVVTTTGA